MKLSLDTVNKEAKWFTLSTILGRVKQIFDDTISGNSFWMKVEVSQLKRDRKGHVYLELVENNGGITLAKARGTIWNYTANVIYTKLDKEADNILKDGAEILCLCELVFSPMYGVSINILDVDLSFSLGEVERKKQETIQKLTEQGLLDLNKQLSYPVVIQKIALVGSVDTAGYIDFINQLEYNEYGFSFVIDNFDCRVQGDNAHVQIIEKLNQIAVGTYDVVVVLRGGGAALDLDEFNNYALAQTIARMHTPVFTGIGHEVDSTVADYVAHTRFKTPSAVAAFIVERAFQYSSRVHAIYDSIMSISRHTMEVEQMLLDKISIGIKGEAKRCLTENKNELRANVNQLVSNSKSRLQEEQSKLEMAYQTIQFKPTAVLQSQTNRLRERGKLLSFFFEQRIQNNQKKIDQYSEILVLRVQALLRKEKARMEYLVDIPELYDWNTLFKKGFAIIRFQGKTITEFTSLKENDILEIEIYNKRFALTIKDIKALEQWKHLPTKKQQLS